MVADARPAKSVAEAMPHAAATIAKRLRILVIFQSVIFDFLRVVKCEPSGRAGRFSDRKQPGAWGIGVYLFLILIRTEALSEDGAAVLFVWNAESVS